MYSSARQDEEYREDNDHPIVGHSASDGSYVIDHPWQKPTALGPDGPYRYGSWQVEFWDCSDHPQYGPHTIWVTPAGVVRLYEQPDAPSNKATGFVSGVDVHLPIGGRISGVLVDEHGDPAVGVCVAAFDGTHLDWLLGLFYPDYTVRTDNAGRFTISALGNAPGGVQQNAQTIVDYRVLAGDCSGSNYNPEWYKSYLVPPNDCCWPQRPAGSYNYENADPIIVHTGQTTEIGTLIMHPPLPMPSPTPTPSEAPSPSDSPTDSPSPTPSAS